MSHTARRFFTGKNSCTDGNWWALSSHHKVIEFRNVMYNVLLLHRMDFSSRKDQVSGRAPICVDTSYPKGEMFRTIGDTEAATVLGLMVVVLSLSISSSLTAW